MLAHNEARQTVMVDMYNRVVTLLPDSEESSDLSRSYMTADSSLPDAGCKYFILIYHVYWSGTSSRHILNIFVTQVNNEDLIPNITQCSDNVTSDRYIPKNNFNSMHKRYHWTSLLCSLFDPVLSMTVLGRTGAD